MRKAEVHRATSETEITVSLCLDGTGTCAVHTGIGFLDHMLEQLARHGLLDLTLRAEGDLHIDAHHTVEDTGIALGRALAQALGDKRGIHRYGHAYVPMDEALCRAVLDFSGRPYLVWDVPFTQNRLGDMDTELFREWFQALSNNAGLTLHVAVLYGRNNHHMIEGCFKALARALRAAVAVDSRRADAVPSTKGVLEGGPAT